MPPKNKHKSANERRHPHDNGLVPSTARVKKQRSTGLLNGGVHSSSSSSVDAAKPAPATTTVQPDRSAASLTSNDVYRSNHVDVPSAAPSDMDRLPAMSRRSSSMDQTAAEAGQYGADKHDKNISSGLDGNTVVKSRSLGDIVAILVLLLQLHPLLLFVVQFLFCTLMGPPFEWLVDLAPTGWFPHDWLLSAADNPPLWMVAVMDVILGIAQRWMPSGQDLFLDCAQMVIAVSLGGAITHHGPWTSRNAGTCLAVIGLRYFVNYEWVQHHAFTLFSTALARANLDSLAIPSMPTVGKLFFPAEHTWFCWYLEIHIIAQCLNRTIIRHVNRSGTQSSASSNRRSDPEAAASLAHIPNEAIVDASSGASTDGRPPGPPPSGRDGNQKAASSGKKRRKQAHFARSQQPFWAALAFGVLKSKVSGHESVSSQNEKENIHNANGTGRQANHSFQTSIWITDIHESEIEFTIALGEEAAQRVIGEQRRNDDSSDDSSDASTSEATLITVRVNDARWTSVSICDCGQVDDNYLMTGKIFGLTPSSNYLLEFDEPETEQVVYRTSLVTRPAANSGQGHAISAQPQSALRPDSPTTTLKNSIKAAESQLAEARAKSKKTRKDHKTALTQLSREVDNAENRVSSAGGNDARQRQRAIQHEQNIVKADREREAFVTELEQLGPIPAEQAKAYEASKQQWQEARAEHDQVQAETNEFKAECDRRVAAQVAENNNQTSKRDKLLQKLQRLDSQHTAMAAENAKSQQERDARNWQRNSQANERARVEQSYLITIGNYEQQRHAFDNAKSELERHIQALESSFNSTYPTQYAGLPQTPESSYANLAYGNRGASTLNPIGSAMQFPVVHPGAIGSRRGSLQRRNRERKSSMLSDASGFTDENVNGYGHAHHDDASRQNSEGSVVNSVIHRAESDHGSYREGTPDPRLSPIGTKHA